MFTSSTQPSTTSSIESPHSPWIPPELVSLILTKLWEEPLSSAERAASLKNIVLVNRTWLTIVAPITSCDVHILNERGAYTFVASIPKHPYHKDLFSSEASRFITEMCRSITFHVGGNASRGGLAETSPAVWDVSQLDAAIAHVLYMTPGRPHWLPNLRHMSFQYTDWAYDDIFEQLKWHWVPKQVTHLSINYSFSDSASVTAFESATTLRWSSRKCTRWFYHIKRVSFSGMSTRLVANFFRVLVCSNVETLEIAHPMQLAVLAPLPPRVHALILCHPGIAISQDMMDLWGLEAALDAGLFREGTKPRIVIRSGTPDPVAFIGLKRTCQGFHADLVSFQDVTRFLDEQSGQRFGKQYLQRLNVQQAIRNCENSLATALHMFSMSIGIRILALGLQQGEDTKAVLTTTGINRGSKGLQPVVPPAQPQNDSDAVGEPTVHTEQSARDVVFKSQDYNNIVELLGRGVTTMSAGDSRSTRGPSRRVP